jgi:hypothetical protein
MPRPPARVAALTPGGRAGARGQPDIKRRGRLASRIGNALKWLGIAYFHMLFGWGPGGGSPFGLLLLLALVAWVAWLVSRSRRRRERWYGAA